MKTVVQFIAISLVAFGMSAIPGKAQYDKANASSSVSKGDRKFMEEAAQGNLAEVEFGKIAEKKTSNSDVKNFAKKVVSDHGKANDDLKDIAKKLAVELPTDINANDRAEKENLEKLNGPDFDSAYMSAMVKDHRQDVEAFRHEATKGDHPDLRTYATGKLETLREHLKLAEDVEKKVGTKTSASVQ